MNNKPGISVRSASKLACSPRGELLPQRLHRCKVNQLRKIAKQQGITKTERMRREELLSALQRPLPLGPLGPISKKPRNYTVQRATLIHHRMTAVQKKQSSAAKKIAKWWRYWKEIRQIEDPITLEGIDGQPFIFVSKNPPYLGYTFGANSLATYVVESLNFHNPLTREEFKPVEISRLAHLSGNAETLFAYQNRAHLTEERELRESAMKSYEWDIEECVNTVLTEGEEMTDQYGIADTRDIQDLVHDLEIEIMPEMSLALRGLLHYEKMPRMERKAAIEMATKMIQKIQQKCDDPPFVDQRILDFLCKFFARFIDAVNLSPGETGNLLSGSWIQPAMSPVQFVQHLISQSPGNSSMYVAMETNDPPGLNHIASALHAMISQQNYHQGM